MDYPCVILTQPFCMHFTYYKQKEKAPAGNNRFLGCYFGDQYTKQLGSDLFPLHSVMGETLAKIFNIEEQQKDIELLFQMIEKEFAENSLPKEGPCKSIQQKLAFAMIFSLLDRSAQKGNTTVSFTAKNYISEVLPYIMEHMHENPTTEQIAEHFFVSRNKLVRDFRNYMQMSINEFTAACRLNIIKNYLSEGSKTIREISEMCGFKNDIYLYSFFKRHTGKTPRDYFR
ncbi:MAG: helix-turn-helix transcriptional regulator [Eubacteriales bacterium]